MHLLLITVVIVEGHIKSQSIPFEDLTGLPDLCLLSIFIIRKSDSNLLNCTKQKVAKNIQ